MPPLGLATNASFPSADAVTSCGLLTVGTCPGTVPAAGATTASALASRSSTSSRASPLVWAAAAPAPASNTPAQSAAVHRIACIVARTEHSLPRCPREAPASRT